MSLEIIVSENSATKNGRETYIGAKKIKYKQTEDLCCLREIADQNNRRFMMTKKTEE